MFDCLFEDELLNLFTFNEILNVVIIDVKFLGEDLQNFKIRVNYCDVAILN